MKFLPSRQAAKIDKPLLLNRSNINKLYPQNFLANKEKEVSDCCTGSCGCGKVINAPVVTPVIGSKRVEPGKYKGSAAKVFFSPIIDAEHLIKLYNLVNSEIYGKVAIKLHTGEKHGPNILPRDLVQALQATIPNSNIVETNTLYEGDRYTTESHRETIKVNGWTFCPVDIHHGRGRLCQPAR